MDEGTVALAVVFAISVITWGLLLLEHRKHRPLPPEEATVTYATCCGCDCPCNEPVCCDCHR